MKKQLKKELPRIEKELNTVLMQWEEDHERFFMVHDSRYLDSIQLQWEEKKMNKCNEKAKRVSRPYTCYIMVTPLCTAKAKRSSENAGDDIWKQANNPKENHQVK